MFTFPALIGHRGVAGHAPENTLQAIRTAGEMGLKMVEVDVKLTQDQRPIVFHDDKLDRTTDGAGRVKDTPLEEINHLDAGITFSREFIGEPVPTLEEVLDLAIEMEMQLNLELKPCPGTDRETAAIALDIAQAMWPDDLPPPLISSFSEISMKVAMEVAPDWPRALLVEKIKSDWRDKAEALNAICVIADEKKLDAKIVKEVKQAGVPLIAWTVNDQKRALTLLDWGVDGLITDSPPTLAGPAWKTVHGD